MHQRSKDGYAKYSELPPPKNWDEFEEICADLFSDEWQDRNATRNGRQGQRQHGVDIYGKPQGRGMAGVQCKGKRNWPPSPLRKSEIDKEIAEAKKFRPRLKEFTIATPAGVQRLGRGRSDGVRARFPFRIVDLDQNDTNDQASDKRRSQLVTIRRGRILIVVERRMEA